MILGKKWKTKEREEDYRKIPLFLLLLNHHCVLLLSFNFLPGRRNLGFHCTNQTPRLFLKAKNAIILKILIQQQMALDIYWNLFCAKGRISVTFSVDGKLPLKLDSS
jgi:hypothetical protein